MSHVAVRHVPSDVPPWQQDMDEVITQCVKVNGDDDASDDEDEVSACACSKLAQKAVNPDSMSFCCDANCINFAMQIECVQCIASCKNKRFQKRIYADIDVVDMEGKGFGLVAKSDIPSGQFIREYVGELINSTELSMRQDASAGARHLYILQLKSGNFIDASRKGSISRFINHSCEPNCKIEIWRVKGKLRVGIFTAKHISSGTELSFDYQWKVSSSRGLTKCYCGTASCRGYLEVLSKEQQENIAAYVPRKGIWTKSMDVTQEDGSCISHEWLIGKRVKVWWHGNQTYFEADVKSVKEQKDGKKAHVLHYLFDDTMQDEVLIGRCNEWMLLDETRAELAIKKKSKEDNEYFDPLPEPSVVTLSNAPVNASSAIHAMVKTQQLEPFVRKSKVIATIQFNVAVLIVDATASGSDKKTAVDHSSLIHRSGVWEQLKALLHNQFQITTFVSAKGVAADVDYLQDAQSLTLVGERDSIDGFLSRCGDLQASMTAEKSKADREKSISHLRNKQALLLTNDWRLLPTIPAAAAATSELSKGTTSAIALLNAGSISQPDLLAMRELPVANAVTISTAIRPILSRSASDVAMAVTVAYDISEQTRRSLLSHLKGMIKRSKLCSQSTTVIAINLVLRLSRYLDDASFLDFTSVIGAVFMLAQKIDGTFKPKNVKRIVRCSYCQVYSRNESDVGSSSDSYVQRTVSRESVIVSLLRHDVFLMDPSFIFYVCVSARACGSYTQSQWSAYHARASNCMDWSSILASTCSVVWVSLPFELSYPASCLMAIMIQVIATNFSVYRSMSDAIPEGIAPPIEFESVYLACVNSIKMDTDTLLWVIQVLCQAAVDIAVDDIEWLILPTASSSNASVLDQILAIVPHLSKHYIGDLGTRYPYSSDNSSSSQPQDTLKLRCPWLHDCKHGAVACIHDTNSIAAIGKDLYNAGISCDSLTACNAGHIVNAMTAVDNTVVGSLRSWPTVKQLHKDSKKAAAADIADLGFSSYALQELIMLQQLHYLSSGGISKHVIQPFAIVEVPGSLELPRFSTGVSHRSSIGGDDDTRNGLTSTDDVAASDAIVGGEVQASSSISKLHNPLTVHRLLAFSPVMTSLQSILSLIPTGLFQPLFAKQLCHDVLSASFHCVSCGVYFKWITLDEVFLSSDGRLIIGGLSGAQQVGVSNMKAVAVTAQTTASGSGKRKRKSGELDLGDDTIATEQDSGKAKEGTSLPCLSTTAPEIVMGAKASIESSVWSAVAVCVHILTGKPIVKSGATEEKHMQYLYRTLGTPKLLGYDMREFAALPMATAYGRHIKADDGSTTEGRSRVFKILQEKLPPDILTALSCKATVTSTIVGDKTIDAESDQGRVIDFLCSGLHLVPGKRTGFSSLLAMPLFTTTASGGTLSMRQKQEQLQKIATVMKTKFGCTVHTDTLIQCTAEPQCHLVAAVAEPLSLDKYLSRSDEGIDRDYENNERNRSRDDKGRDDKSTYDRSRDDRGRDDRGTYDSRHRSRDDRGRDDRSAYDRGRDDRGRDDRGRDDRGRDDRGRDDKRTYDRSRDGKSTYDRSRDDRGRDDRGRDDSRHRIGGDREVGSAYRDRHEGRYDRR